MFGKSKKQKKFENRLAIAGAVLYGVKVAGKLILAGLHELRHRDNEKRIKDLEDKCK